MHEGSIAIMEWFVGRYLRNAKDLRILDVGSRMVKGQLLSYKPILSKETWQYTGADVEAGDNVDVVLNGPYNWQFPSDYFNVVACGQVLEHVEFPWVFMGEVARVMKPRGLACIIAPSCWHRHRYPIDTFRYYPDGMIALCKWAGLKVVKTRQDRANPTNREQSTYLIAQKR